jgi:hypothetical protein
MSCDTYTSFFVEKPDVRRREDIIKKAVVSIPICEAQMAPQSLYESDRTLHTTERLSERTTVQATGLHVPTQECQWRYRYRGIKQKLWRATFTSKQKNAAFSEGQ